jgi:uncharacterized protein (TIGR02757 family)
MTSTKTLKKHLEALYSTYNRRGFVPPDPLRFLYPYEDPADQEVVGMIASSLAYGRVKQIERSITRVLDRLPSPASYLAQTSLAELKKTFRGFKHRFTTDRDLCELLYGIKKVRERYGSLQACFMAGWDPRERSLVPGLGRFVEAVRSNGRPRGFSLLPHPGRGSACKRLNLYLRWMVRKDAVDPGPWTGIDPSLLIIPLDTHMFRIARTLGLTRRKGAGLQCALEITRAFKAVAPNDPVRYDFSLTRLGILQNLKITGFWARCLPPA